MCSSDLGRSPSFLVRMGERIRTGALAPLTHMLRRVRTPSGAGTRRELPARAGSSFRSWSAASLALMALLVLQSADPAAAQLPGFGVRQIRQSNPLIGAVNAITVALEANDDAELSSAKSAVLTLSNLRNLDRAQGRTTTTQGWSLPLHPVQGGNGGHALFCVAQAGHNASALVLASAPASDWR